MATALSATYQAGTTTYPPRVLLQVSGAPTQAPLYASNFASTVDGWTGSAGTTLTPNQSPNVALYIGGTTAYTTPATVHTFSRTVTGLTVGQSYRYQLMLDAGSYTLARVLVSGMTPGAWLSTQDRASTVYDFTATATSHVVQVQVKLDGVPAWMVGNVVPFARIDTVKVSRVTGWQGTTISRTDYNGTRTVRESAGGQDATGTSGSGVMTVYDYEAALAGTVTYTVTDGNGGTANASPSVPTDPGVWLTLPASTTNLESSSTPPTFTQLELVTGYEQARTSNGSIHTIIGRQDPIANPGPLATGAGTITLWCSDYYAAALLRNQLRYGDVALLRQPTHRGMDAPFVVREMRLVPETTTDPQRWAVALTYQEVAHP